MAYTYSNGQWGNYQDNIKGQNFKSTLTRLEFASCSKLESLLGNVEVYSRSGQAAEKWPYSFVCTLSIGYGGAYYWVWVPTLPDMFQFLKEIGAKEREVYSGEIRNNEDLIDYLSNTFFSEALRELNHYLRDRNKQ
jgi:hypothetical protein